MKKAIYRFRENCGRMGSLEGIFIATSKQVNELIKSKIQVYFGDVLGKHSEIYGAINKKHIILVTNDSEAVNSFEKYKLTSGHNPFDYPSVNFEVEGVDFDDMTLREIIDKRLEAKTPKKTIRS